jgi:hypothetical protein
MTARARDLGLPAALGCCLLPGQSDFGQAAAPLRCHGGCVVRSVSSPQYLPMVHPLPVRRFPAAHALPRKGSSVAIARGGPGR